MAASLKISFNKHSNNELSVKNGSIPLIDIMKESYSKASFTLQCRNLLFLSQVVDEDSEHLLTNQLVAHQWQYKYGIQPLWLSILKSTILKEPNSRKLKNEWM